MAIIKCPECGRDISDKANKCIHCGKSLNKAIVGSDNFTCPECGAELQEGTTVCKECGCPIESNKNSEPKKKMKLVLIGACVLAFICICTIFVFMHNSNPVKKYLSLFEKDKMKEAVEVYTNKIMDNSELLETLSSEQNTIMDNIYSQYKENTISYENATGQVKKYAEYEASKIYAAVIMDKIEILSRSRNSYEEAENAYKSGDIPLALLKYDAVDEEDKNYAAAQEKVKNLKESYKAELLKEADNLAQNRKYNEALECLEKVISIIGSSDEVTVLKDQYSDMKSEQFAKIVVINKTVTPKDSSKWIFSNYVNFVFMITNNSDKEIRGIEGALIINDLFGKKIMRLNCDFTGLTIKPGETFTKNGMSFECNQFVDKDWKLYNTEYQDLEFIYEMSSVVFTDGTTIQVE